MRISRKFPLWVAVILLSAAMMSVAWSDDDHDHARQLVKRGEIVQLETIIENLPGEGGRILEVELEHEDGRLVYEVEILNTDGRVHEYLFDARTGDFLEMED